MFSDLVKCTISQPSHTQTPNCNKQQISDHLCQISGILPLNGFLGVGREGAQVASALKVNDKSLKITKRAS